MNINPFNEKLEGTLVLYKEPNGLLRTVSVDEVLTGHCVVSYTDEEAGLQFTATYDELVLPQVDDEIDIPDIDDLLGGNP